MIRRALKTFGRKAARILPLRMFPLDAMLRVSQRTSALLARAVYLRDWQLEADGRPQYFKHELNLSQWPFEPRRWSFAARGVYARERMFGGCKVLDLCCGDGSLSYLFFSDIAAHIDAVDNDVHALAYARRYHRAENISYRKLDIVSERWPAEGYDFVVWNAAICYFGADEIDAILRKIAGVGRSSMIFVGMLPQANGWVDHKTEFADSREVQALLSRYFAAVAVKEVAENGAATFYFQAAESRVPGDNA